MEKELINEKVYNRLSEEYKAIETISKETKDLFDGIIGDNLISDIDTRVICTWANLNKNSCLQDYQDECLKGDCYERQARCTKLLDFEDHYDLYFWFCNNLLTSFSFIDNTGGTSFDDKDGVIEKFKDKYGDSWIYHSECYKELDMYSDNCILVRYEGKN